MITKFGCALLSAAVCLLPGLSATAEEFVAEFDFGKPGQDWKSYGNNQFAGVLPRGLIPDFSWNRSVVESETVSEGKERFTRFNVTKYDRGVQFATASLRLKNDVGYRITVVARGGSSVDVQLRRVDKPYTVYFRATAKSALDLFVSDTIYVNLPENPKHQDFTNIAFYFLLQPGVTDLRLIKIEEVTQAELQAAILRPEKGTANFFRNSRFPLGLPAGWTVQQSFEQGEIGVAVEPGPSGCPALQLRIDNAPLTYGVHFGVYPVRIFSEPFQVADPMKTNSVAFSYRSTGEWKAFVVSGLTGEWKALGKTVLPETPTWQRGNFMFQPQPLARSYNLVFSGKGTLLLDSLQVYAGGGKVPYASQGQCEVALGLPQSDAAIARIQFTDEPAVLDYCVSGDCRSGVLKSKVVNIYGGEKARPDIPLDGAKSSTAAMFRGRLNYAVFPTVPCGQFRVEAWVERDGKRISPFNEMVVTRIRRPLYWGKDAPASPFGAHFTASPIIIPMMKAAGINSVRLHDAGTPYMGWYFLEPEKGKWMFRDDCIQRFRDSRIRIIGNLQTAPLWASSYRTSGKKDIDPYYDRYWTVTDWDGWDNYVRTVCTRYKGVIDEYLIWNEPEPNHGAGFLHDAHLGGKTFSIKPEDAAKNQARLCESVARIAKEVAPSIRVSGANILRNDDKGRAFTKMMIDAGAYRHADFIDYHDYNQKTENGFPGDTAERNFNGVLKPIRDANIRKPIHMSEGAAVGRGGKYAGFYKHTLTWNQDYAECLAASDEICRFIFRLLSLGCERINLYSPHCYSYLGYEFPSYYRVLSNEDGYPEPALAAFSNLAWLLEDRKFAECVQVGDDVWAYIFEGRDASVAVISGLKTGKYTVPSLRDVEALDLFGNPLPQGAKYKGQLLYILDKCPAKELAERLKRQ